MNRTIKIIASLYLLLLALGCGGGGGGSSDNNDTDNNNQNAANFVINATSDPNGKIDPEGDVDVSEGGDQTFRITPNADYHILDVTVDGVSKGSITAYTFDNVKQNHTITASFEADSPPEYVINASSDQNGSIDPEGDVIVTEGADQTFTITPNANYHVLDVTVDGVSQGPLTTYTFTNVTQDHTIAASFEVDPPPNYEILATSGQNGSIDPEGQVVVSEGSDQTFTITPDADFHVLDVIIDGISLGPMTSYTFTNVTQNHTITASFDKQHQFITMGDSITAGVGDDFPGDDVSQDGKNSGGGYQPILNDLLTSYENGFPHDIVNEGVGGDTSADGLAFIPTALGTYPDAMKYLLQYGTNDARPWAPVPSGLGLDPGDGGYPGTYKDNMQQMIAAINNAGKEVCLAKPGIALGDSASGPTYPDPDTGARSVLIKEYNQVIDELVIDASNAIVVTPPDFYNFFKGIDPATSQPRYADQYFDNVHPNGTGYQSMADLWFDALTQ